jgi:hypothetical protein
MVKVADVELVFAHHQRLLGNGLDAVDAVRDLALVGVEQAVQQVGFGGVLLTVVEDQLQQQLGNDAHHDEDLRHDTDEPFELGYPNLVPSC